ncbi:MAG: magnesium transporter CorA family protein [Patescibacteria group bacterium]
MPRSLDASIEQASVGGLTWVFVSSNQKKEILQLKRKYQLHPIDLKSVMPPLQRAHLVQRDEYVFMTLLYPVFDHKTRIIYSSEVDFIITDNQLITVNPDRLVGLREMYEAFRVTDNEGKKINDPYRSGDVYRLLISILADLEEQIYPMLVHLSTDIDEVEGRLFRDYEKNLIQELLRIKTNVVNTRKAIQAHKTVLRQLIKSGGTKIGKTLPYFERLVEQTKEVWDALDVQRDTINALHETNASLIDFRINEIMKTLTIFSVVIFPITLLAAIFGMNTSSMPFVDSPHGFWIIIGIMVTAVTGMLVYFKSKKWF